MEQQKIPPQVPPKPNNNHQQHNGNNGNNTVNTMLALNDNLDAELKHIMKTSQQRLNMGGADHNRTNATPPLPALSPGPGMLMLDAGIFKISI